MKESENELRDIIKKNKNDLIRAERQGQSAKHANNSAILGAIQQLTDLVKLTLPVKVASDSGNNQDDELKRLADSLEKLK